MAALWRASATTTDVRCLWPVSLSITHRAAGLGCPQCHSTRCRLCRCAASGPSSLPSLTGPRGSGRSHSLAVSRHEASTVDCAGVLLPARLRFHHSPGCEVGPPIVSRHKVSTVQARHSRFVPSSVPRPSLSRRQVSTSCRHSGDTVANIQSGRPLRQTRSVTVSGGCSMPLEQASVVYCSSHLRTTFVHGFATGFGAR